jgi:hypothetical protein
VAAAAAAAAVVAAGLKQQRRTVHTPWVKRCSSCCNSLDVDMKFLYAMPVADKKCY